ncbi:MAG: sulfatase-like hydrolase/transferase, partial [Bacteroidota bacterium]
FGKWGLGEHGSAGEPNDQGFDEWLGFLNQKRAHDHYIHYFWQNKDTFFLKGNSPKYNVNNTTYSHDLFTQYALDFVAQNKDTSFFLYLPYCLPHDAYQIPSEDTLKFTDKAWTANEKVYAAMVEKVDKDVGQL